MNNIFVGMDLHKKTSSFCVMEGGGNVMVEKTLATVPRGDS